MSEVYETTPMATAVDFATFLQRDLTAAETATVTPLLASASREVRKFCRWHVWPLRAEDPFTIDGNGTPVLMLPSQRITAVDSVTESDTLLTVDQYEWSADGMLKRLGGAAWPATYRSVVVELTHGYDDDDTAPADSSKAPADLRDLVCSVAARPFDSPRGRIRESAGAAAVTYPQTGAAISGGIILVRGERDQLRHYRIGAA